MLVVREAKKYRTKFILIFILRYLKEFFILTNNKSLKLISQKFRYTICKLKIRDLEKVNTTMVTLKISLNFIFSHYQINVVHNHILLTGKFDDNKILDRWNNEILIMWNFDILDFWVVFQMFLDFLDVSGSTSRCMHILYLYRSKPHSSVYNSVLYPYNFRIYRILLKDILYN